MPDDRVAPRHVFDPAPEPLPFRFANGERAATLAEFADRFATLPDHVLDYHRDHYEGWLAHVVHDGVLADRARFFARSGIATREYREVMTMLLQRRLAELRDHVPPAPRERRARLVERR